MTHIALVDTARNGFMWEVLAYDSRGREIGKRFFTQQEAINFAKELERRKSEYSPRES